MFNPFLVGKNRKKLLSFQRKTDTSGRGVAVRGRREYCSHVNVQSIKIKCVNNYNAYKDVIFMQYSVSL